MVNQKASLNTIFLDLCLSICCANTTPGQPPIKANKCKILSWVRHSPRYALDLSKV